MNGKERHTAAFEQAELLLRYLRGNLLPEENRQLEIWLAEDPRNVAFLKSLTAESTMDECLHFLATTDTADALARVQGRIQARERPATPMQAPARKWRPVWRAAAAILLLASLAAGGLWWSQAPQLSPAKQLSPQIADDVAPGSNRATLLLADGSVIVLDEEGGHTIRNENGVHIRQQGAEVIYEVKAGSRGNGQQEWNTITTPRGGQYRLALPDGSSVWLNAASELRFPASFTDSRRTVTLKGEAYFQIAPDSDRPFYVKTGELTVEVLGTHFNVNAYDDNPAIRTTLIEGKVKLHTPSAEKQLLPGTQASMGRQDGRLEIGPADIEEVIAWKNGLFRFSGEPIEEVMKKLARWYNVEAVYSETRPKTLFSGMISRQVPLSRVLKMLETTGGAAFRMEDKKVIVMHDRAPPL